ncbi:CHAT domain-containing protein [uncultured Algibacter sp.]|uniref:CHAT domain-containing protein n=1 Tax=uncultured Algibacter sp. TaxID=298659 RepID=UPI0026287017|nr:CHAT domain-containing protein [uncultured Algibacter sp.]
MNLRYILFALITFVYVQIHSAQNTSTTDLNYVKELITVDSLSKAETEIVSQISIFKSKNNHDTLVHYIYTLGKIQILKNAPIDKAILLSETISKVTTSKITLSKLNLELAKLYFEKGNQSEAYQYAKKAKMFAEGLTNKSLLLEAEYYLGDYSMKLGNITNLENHIRAANSLIKKNKDKPYAYTARVLNLMGAVMFFSSKQDSAVYYFENALKNINNLPNNIENQLYLPAAIKGNLFLIKLNQGKHSESRKLVEESLILNQKFLNQTNNHPLLKRVKRNIALGYTNLSSLYFDLGDFNRSDQITQLSLGFAKENFLPKTEEYFLTTLAVAEVKHAKLELKKALIYLKEAEACLDNMPQENNQLRAYLYNDYGSTFYKMKNYEKALFYFEKSNTFHEKSNPDEYDSNRLYQTMNFGILLGKTGQKEKAIDYVTNAYNYVVKEKRQNNYLENVLILTLATINFDCNDYEQTIKWCNKSFNIYNKNSKNKGYDKLLFEEKKAELILLNAKSKYHLNQDKSVTFLKSLLLEIEEAILILENRKSIISSLESVNTLLEENKSVFDFAKKLNLELYNLTEDSAYLTKVVSLHESALYNRIRSRLNINKGTSFADVPLEIIAKENEIKNKLNIKIEEQDSQETAIENIVKSNVEWREFLENIKKNHPKYYKMRYGTIGESLAFLQDDINENTSVLRYFFIDDALYVYLLKRESQKLFKLDHKLIKKHIDKLNENQSQLSETSDVLYELYQSLWKPFEDEITTKNIIIIPDGNLYNISFETLTPKKIKTFKDLATNSLLANYNISYNYSLYLLGQYENTTSYKNKFIAFAPEFNDEMKKNYKLAITDSLSYDKTYLTLLQQPFNVDLAKAYAKLFDGNYFLNENSTERIFKQNASEHKIIHIGTHAESNNISPELSRLLFAKNVSNDNEDGFLYAYEIYDTSLNSNLAILTACETGKPSYQAGEGMISLAHAFNYAGSESILTSLWKVDERSTAEIIESFYKNIDAEKPKDEALRLAKLDYINNTEGRTVAPKFWAGLVLMGDATPIEISNGMPIWQWLLIIGSIVLGIFFLNRYKKR